MNIAIHGERELLVRMREDLLGAAFVDDSYWNKRLIERGDYSYLHVNEDGYRDLKVSLYDHGCFVNEPIIYLTHSNYNEILNIIIERKENG